MGFECLSIGKYLLLIICSAVAGIKCDDASLNTAFLAPAAAAKHSNQLLQPLPADYFHTAQSLAYSNAAPGFPAPSGPHYQGYNYQTPASTYGSYSAAVTGTHKSQTPPLAVSLHPDDYEKFDKSPQTFFIPRNKKLLSHASKSATKYPDEFYVPRGGAQQKKLAEEIAVENEKFPPISEPTLPSENPQNWKPLHAIQTTSVPLQTQAALNSPPNVALEDFPNPGYTQQRPTKVGFNTEARLPEISNFRNERIRTNAKTNSITLKQAGNIGKIETVSQPANCPSHVEESLPNIHQEVLQQPAIASPVHEHDPRALLTNEAFIPTRGPSSNPNPNGIYLSNRERQQRINILKSLLAEYLALTLPEAPQPIPTNINYEESGGSAASPFPAPSARNPVPDSSRVYSDAPPYQSQPRYRPSITIPLRRPHLTYGTPFAEGLNSNIGAPETPQTS